MTPVGASLTSPVTNTNRNTSFSSAARSCLHRVPFLQLHHILARLTFWSASSFDVFEKRFIAAFTPLLGGPSKSLLAYFIALWHVTLNLPQFMIFSIFLVQIRFPLFKGCLWCNLVVSTASMFDDVNILFSFRSFKKSSLVGGIHLLRASKIMFWSSLHAANTHYPGLFNLLVSYVLSHWFITVLLSQNPKSAAHIISYFCCLRIEKQH